MTVSIIISCTYEETFTLIGLFILTVTFLKKKNNIFIFLMLLIVEIKLNIDCIYGENRSSSSGESLLLK